MRDMHHDASEGAARRADPLIARSAARLPSRASGARPATALRSTTGATAVATAKSLRSR